MKSDLTTKTINFLFFLFTLFCSLNIFSQNDSLPKAKSEFWKKVQFGGGLGLGFGNGFTNLSLSPTGYYNINTKTAVGIGLTGSYVAQKSNASNFNTIGYKSSIFGASVIGLYSPIEEIQLSGEVEQLKVNRNFENPLFIDDSFWNTALFLGVGYRTQNVTLGVRYNVLHNDNNNVYPTAFSPFIRVIF